MRYLASSLTLILSAGAFLSGCEELPVSVISQIGTPEPYTIQVPAPTAHVSKVVTGNNHSCALYTSGEIRCWGRNHLKQLGLGDTVDRSSPTVLASVTGAVDLFAGGDQTCVRVSDSSIACWGDGADP